MAEIFLKVVNMSISATWMVLIVLITRLCLKNAPKWISVSLWALVGFRLICPFSLESAFSLIPTSEVVRPEIMFETAPSIQTGVPVLDAAVNPVISQSFAADPSNSANPLQIIIPVGACFWLSGIAVLLVYAVVSYFRVKYHLREATLQRENIYLGDINAPFVLGIMKPMIYLPYNMSESDMQYVIAHERAHIQRKDHWWKPLGFFILSIHWFNPVMWFAYILFCRDIELSCDERLVKAFSPEQRADYSDALLRCSTGHWRVAPCPLAFGEGGIKTRIKAVLYYKKPALWIIILAVVLCAVIVVCCLTDPISQTGGFDPYKIPVFSSDPEELQKQAEQIESKLGISGDYKFSINADGVINYNRIVRDGKVLMQITEDEAVAIAEGYLKEMGLLPQDAYHTRVTMIMKTAMDLNGEGEKVSGVEWVKVFFYRVFHGTDVVTDQYDGITLSFDAQGVLGMTYLWRDMQEGKLPKTEKPITAEEARQVCIDYMSTQHIDHFDHPENLTAYEVYACFNQQMRPCWQVSEGEAYSNSVYIDMFTGEVLYG